MDMNKLLQTAKWLLIGVLSVKAGEAYSGQPILPQNPLDIVQLFNNLANIDLNTILIILGTFLFFLILIVAIKKKRQRQAVQVIYMPIKSYLPRK